MLETNKIYQGDCLEILKGFPDRFLDCCVTSPPYYGLRDYGCENQIGLEETPEDYIAKLVKVFREVRRCLKDDGTLWVNIGDSYAGGQGRWGGQENLSGIQKGNKGSLTQIGKPRKWQHKIIKPKDLIGIPWMLAFALRADGWYLRQDIIWSKPNCMPESVKDRCTKSHEYIFLFSKSPQYYFDGEAISEPITESSIKRYNQNIESQMGSYTPGKCNGNMKAVMPKYGKTDAVDKHFNGKRNKRDVWNVSTKGVKEAHFATFPEDLIEPCILAGCPKDGIVIDPFFGSGTTGRVAERLGRQWVGIELNPEYVEIARKRTNYVQIQMF